jgi:phage baseplate assembly protein gpV
LPEYNLSVSKRAEPNNSADREVSHRRNGSTATYEEKAHIHPANKPAFSL